MLIKFCHAVEVDPNKVPDNFDEQIRVAFKDYTKGTACQYRFHDKLAFIDLMSKYLHNAHDSEEAVKKLILDGVEFQLDEYGEFPTADEFWNMDFMAACYEKGRQDASLYDHYTGDHHVDDTIMWLLIRAIKAAMEYGEG